MNRNTKEFKITESQTKFSQARIQHVEKYLGFFCDTLASITRKNARLRDKGDILSKYMMEYAAAEKANVTTQNSLVKFAENFSAIQDYRQAEINRLEALVVRPLAAYGEVCKHMKTIVKSSTASHSKELKQKQQLEKLRQKAPGDRHQIDQAENELQRASKDAVHYSQTLEGEMAKFEKEKIVDLKAVLANFVNVEMSFHARALEYYAKCAENVASIDENVDLEEFKTRLMATGGFTRQQLNESLLSNTGGYNNTLGDTNRSVGSTLSEDRRQIHNYNSNMYGEIEDDDDDDDDDDDVESEEEDYNRARLRK